LFQKDGPNFITIWRTTVAGGCWFRWVRYRSN